MKRHGRQPKPRSLFSPISAKPCWPKELTPTGVSGITTRRSVTLSKHVRFLPNSSRIPESLAYVARRRGQWDLSETYFNEAERLDPRSVNLLSQHASTYAILRRFPEAQRKLDQVSQH